MVKSRSNTGFSDLTFHKISYCFTVVLVEQQSTVNPNLSLSGGYYKHNRSCLIVV